MAEPSQRPENSLRVSAEPLAAGLRLGGARFLLKRLLGRGSYSEVWLAWDRTLEQDVALKFLPLELGTDPGTVDLLTAAAQRGAQLVHPAFVRPIEVVRAAEFVAISMEHVDGWSLATLKVDQPENRFRLEDIQLWIQQVCFALDYAHHELLVHGALKPANLLLDNRDELKITDHALARLAQLALASRNHPPGAVAYLSPQQINGAESTIQDDVYAVGATIYDLLTGTPPFFKGDIQVQVRDLVPPMMTDRLRERGIEDAFPVAWEKTVAACLAKDPAKRPQTANELLAGLEPAKTVTPKVSPPHAVSPEPVAPPARSPAPPFANPMTGGSADRVRGSKPAVEPNPAAVEPGATATPVAAVARTELLHAEKSAAQCGAGVEPAQSPAYPSPSAVSATPTIGDANIQSPPGSPPRQRFNLAVSTAAVAFVAMLATIWLALHLRNASSEPDVAASGPPGALDASFNVGGGADNEIRSLALQPDGRILVGGRFLNFDGTMLQGLARLGTNGSPERTFAPHTSGAVHAIALQADGKLLIGGDFMNISGQPRRHLARLNADGTLDRSFSTQAALNREVRALLVQPDGKILAGGSFNYVAGQREGGVTRLNSDGTRDRSFNPGAGAKDMVWALALQPDGKILVAGDFTTFDQVPSGHIARLKPDGTLDPSFKTGTGANLAILGLAVQLDGKILAAGNFMTFDGRKRARIARLLPDGAVDLTFDPGEGPKGGLRSVALQPNGKILIGGVFDRVAGVPRNGLARLNSDGTLDSGFEPLGAADGGLWRVLVQPDGKVLVAGVFKTFNGADCGRIARLLGDAAKGKRT